MIRNKIKLIHQKYINFIFYYVITDRDQINLTLKAFYDRPNGGVVT